VAVNCCVAPTAMLALDGPTETDLSVLAGAVLLEEFPHPVFAITSRRHKTETGMESNQRRRRAICVTSRKCESAKARYSLKNRGGRTSTSSTPATLRSRGLVAKSWRKVALATANNGPHKANRRTKAGLYGGTGGRLSNPGSIGRRCTFESILRVFFVDPTQKPVLPLR